MPLSLRCFALGIVTRFILYSWICMILITSGLFDIDFLQEHMTDSTYVYVLAIILLIISTRFTITKSDVGLFFVFARKSHAISALSMSLIGIWLAVLVMRFHAIDGYNDVDESYFYYGPLLFLMAFPGSVLLLCVQFLLYLMGLEFKGIEGTSLADHRLNATILWAQNFFVFLVQLHYANKWLRKKLHAKLNQNMSLDGKES